MLVPWTLLSRCTYIDGEECNELHQVFGRCSASAVGFLALGCIITQVLLITNPMHWSCIPRQSPHITHTKSQVHLLTCVTQDYIPGETKASRAWLSYGNRAENDAKMSVFLYLLGNAIWFIRIHFNCCAGGVEVCSNVRGVKALKGVTFDVLTPFQECSPEFQWEFITYPYPCYTATEMLLWVSKIVKMTFSVSV